VVVPAIRKSVIRISLIIVFFIIVAPLEIVGFSRKKGRLAAPELLSKGYFFPLRCHTVFKLNSFLERSHEGKGKGRRRKIEYSTKGSEEKIYGGG
jgi:hypothetical protein